MNRHLQALYLVTVFFLLSILIACNVYSSDLEEKNVNLDTNIKILDFSAQTSINGKPIKKGMSISHKSELIALGDAWVEYEYLTYNDNGNDRIRLINGKLELGIGCDKGDGPDIGGGIKKFRKKVDGCYGTNTSTLYLSQGDIYVSLHKQEEPTLQNYTFTTENVLLYADYGSQFLLTKTENYSAVYVCEGQVNISEQREDNINVEEVKKGMGLVIATESETSIEIKDMQTKAAKGFELMGLGC